MPLQYASHVKDLNSTSFNLVGHKFGVGGMSMDEVSTLAVAVAKVFAHSNCSTKPGLETYSLELAQAAQKISGSANTVTIDGDID